ncbi:MAG: hypothetical protein WAR57_01105, partial [Candidatus Phosphoribacter sp.]
SQIGSTVAATTHGRREPGRPAGADRVILRPSGLSRLTTAGRRVVLTHELTHVSLRAQSIHDLPVWLSEGFAEWVAFRDEGLPVRTIAAVLLERVRAQGPPRSLPTEADFAGQDGEAGVAAAYQGSWLAAQRIVRERGAQALVALLRELGGDPDVLAPVESAELAPDELALERAMSRHIGDGREQFVTLWRAELVALARY